MLTCKLQEAPGRHIVAEQTFDDVLTVVTAKNISRDRKTFPVLNHPKSRTRQPQKQG